MKQASLFLTCFIALIFVSCNAPEKGKEQSPPEEQLTDNHTDSIYKNIKGDGKQVENKANIKYSSIIPKGENSVGILTNTPPAECALPTKIKDLNSGSGFEFYKYTSDMSAEAGYMGFSGSIGKKELLIIQDYVRYQNVTCAGGVKRIGIGLRCFIHVKSLKGKVGATLPNIAASVQLESAKASFSLKSMGFAINGDMLAEGLGGQTEYNVENFGKLAVTFNNVLKTLTDKNETIVISPVELP